jgi:HTH-type transcriptional regulator, sugar sensing transcriptional regulator
MTNRTELINRLGELGMSGYEAKAYLSLVTASRPLNGYEVAKLSGVPRSTVYETLGKLVARGAAFEARAAPGAVAYLPLPPNALLTRMSSEFSASLEALRKELPRIATPQEAHLLHNILDRDALLERATDVIRESRWDLFVSVWPEEFDDLSPVLTDAEARGVDITMLVFGEHTPEIGHTYRHRYSPPEFVMQYLGYRLFGVIGDSKQAVIGGFQASTGWGIYSDNPAVVLLATEYVRHDIAMQILGTNLGGERVAEFVRSNPEFVRLRATRTGGATLATAGATGAGSPAPAARPAAKRTNAATSGNAVKAAKATGGGKVSQARRAAPSARRPRAPDHGGGGES